MLRIDSDSLKINIFLDLVICCISERLCILARNDLDGFKCIQNELIGVITVYLSHFRKHIAFAGEIIAGEDDRITLPSIRHQYPRGPSRKGTLM